MSVQVLTAVFKVPAERFGTKGGASALARKVALICYANVANDDGYGCWPSVDTVGAFIGLTERQTRRVIRSLEEDKLLVQTRGYQRFPPRPTEYRVNLAAVDLLAVATGKEGAA